MYRILSQNDWEPIYTNTNGQKLLTVGFYLNPNDPSRTEEWKQFNDKDGVVAGMIANYTYFDQGAFKPS
jgi:hypothetical protein